MSPYLSVVEGHDNIAVDSMMAQDMPHIYKDPATLPLSLDPFTITTANGFMPWHLPLLDLPPAFTVISRLLSEMPVAKADGSPGLLAKFQLGPTIDKASSIPDLSSEIDGLTSTDGQPDLVTVTAVFRDYSFLASAYLLEPCWERWSKGLEGYGLGRQSLPKCIAGPLMKTAKL